MFNTFSPSGFNQANQAFGTGGSNPLIPILNGAQAAGYGGIASAANYGNGLESQREGLLNNLLSLDSTGGIQGQAAKSANSIDENAFNAGNQGAMALKGMGYGSGASGGLLGSMLGQGAASVNSSNQHYNDPTYISSVLQNAYGTIDAGMQNPLLSQAMSYEAPIMGQNQFNYSTQSPGLLGSIAPILGAVAGGGQGSSFLSSLFGGGGGSSSPSSYWNSQGAYTGPTGF